MGSAFSTKTIYQFIATLESVFAIAVFAFGIKTLVLYFNYVSEDDNAEEPGSELYRNNGREYIKYAAGVAVGQSVVQMLAAILLVVKSNYNVGRDRKDIYPGLVPKFWILHSIIQFALQLAIFLLPTMSYETDKDPQAMKKTLKEFYTYTLVSAFFKIFFIWAVYITLNAPRELASSDPELIHHHRKGSGSRAEPE